MFSVDLEEDLDVRVRRGSVTRAAYGDERDEHLRICMGRQGRMDMAVVGNPLWSLSLHCTCRPTALVYNATTMT